MIGWGIIGVGNVTEVKAAPAIFRSGDSDVVHVMRRDADRARDFAQRHGVERWSWDPRRNRGGEFYETACHTLDLLDWLLGPATDAAGVTSPDTHAVSASYRFTDVTGSGSWAFGTPDHVDETVLIGTRGVLSFASFAPSPIRITTAAGVVNHEIPDPPHVHAPLVATILYELRGTGTCPSTGHSALRTAQIMDAILNH